MMYREGLKPYSGSLRRHKFTGIIAAFGTARDCRSRPSLCSTFPTILLHEIHGAYGAVVAEHAWIPAGGCNLDGMAVSDELAFEAAVEQYRRGYRERKRTGTSEITRGYRFSEVVIHGKKNA